MKKIKLYILSVLMELVFFIIFKTSRWHISGLDRLQRAVENDRPILLCSWHARFVYAVYFFKKHKTSNLWAVSSTHEDSQIMAHFLNRASIGLIRGSSTRGWDNVIKQMLKIFKKTDSIIAITNDGPKGPAREAKLGSYKIALRSDAQIIAMSCNSTTYWEAGSWDRLRLPKPFGNIYIDFSDPMEIDGSIKDVDSADDLTAFLNYHLEKLDEKVL